MLILHPQQQYPPYLTLIVKTQNGDHPYEQQVPGLEGAAILSELL